MRLKLHDVSLGLRDVFRTAYAERHTQRSLIVELEENGCRGYGEATENHFYQSNIADMRLEIENLRPALSAIRMDGSILPEHLHARFEKRLSAFALCAIDEAWHDLYGKIIGTPLYKLWGYTPKPLTTSYTIGLDDIEQMERKIREKSWPIYKIKMQGGEEDIRIIRALRAQTDSIFRVDANMSWTAEETIDKSHLLASLGVEFIEQPLGVGDLEKMKEVYEKSALPLIADESCQHYDDILGLVGRFHGVNLKLTKCGGITNVRRMLSRAKSLSFRTMMGCMVESSVGISALAQFIGELDYVDMDGAMLLSHDIAQGVEVHKEGVVYAQKNGTGVFLKEDA